MDSMQPVRDLRADIGPSERGIAQARADLDAAVDAPRTRPTATVRRPVMVVGGLLGAVAAATAGVLLVPQLLHSGGPVDTAPSQTQAPAPPSPAPDPTLTREPEPPTASTVFASLARNAKLGQAPVAQDGEYLKIDVESDELVFAKDGVGVDPMMIGRSQADSTWLVRVQYAEYVPADLHDEWILPGVHQVEVLQAFGEADQSHIDDWIRLMTGDTETDRPLGGPIDNWSDASGDPLATYFDRIPTDPQALLDWLTPQIDDGVTDPQKVGWVLCHLLAYNVGSAELRSAMYEALSRLPGSELTALDGDRATVTFHTLPGKASDPIAERWDSVTIDLATGIVLETSQRTASTSSAVPDAIPEAVTRYRISVVDEDQVP